MDDSPLSDVPVEELIQQMEQGSLKPTLLTFAAEHVGRHPDKARVKAVLLPLLKHEASYVREGALYGLAIAFDDTMDNDVAQAVIILSEEDEVPVLRDIAKQTLSWMVRES